MPMCTLHPYVFSSAKLCVHVNPHVSSSEPRFSPTPSNSHNRFYSCRIESLSAPDIITEEFARETFTRSILYTERTLTEMWPKLPYW